MYTRKYLNSAECDPHGITLARLITKAWEAKNCRRSIDYLWCDNQRLFDIVTDDKTRALFNTLDRKENMQVNDAPVSCTWTQHYYRRDVSQKYHRSHQLYMNYLKASGLYTSPHSAFSPDLSSRVFLVFQYTAQIKNSYLDRTICWKSVYRSTESILSILK